MQAYVITKRSRNSNYILRVDIQVLALNINHPAGLLLPRPAHHDKYHVHDQNMPVLRPLSRPLSWRMSCGTHHRLCSSAEFQMVIDTVGFIAYLVFSTTVTIDFIN